MARIDPKPTFRSKVTIPVPGGEPSLAVWFVFRHRTKRQLDDFCRGDGATGRSDADTVMGAAESWDLEDPFTEESVERLCQGYHAAGAAIMETYITELMQGKLGN